jgi:hypothetical protein
MTVFNIKKKQSTGDENEFRSVKNDEEFVFLPFRFMLILVVKMEMVILLS